MDIKKSLIFTDAELKSLDERMAGSKKDPHGTFSGRVRPRIIELLEWFKIKKQLEKLIVKNVKRKN